MGQELSGEVRFDDGPWIAVRASHMESNLYKVLVPCTHFPGPLDKLRIDIRIEGKTATHSPTEKLYMTREAEVMLLALTLPIVRVSILEAANRGAGTTPHRCDICGKMFRLPFQIVAPVRMPGLTIECVIDAGGYCAHCNAYMCQQHILARNGHDPAGPGGTSIPIVEFACEKCGRRLDV